MTGLVNSRQACEIAFTGVGFAFGGVAGGGSPVGLIGGAAMGYIVGRLACRFKVFQRAFEDKLGLDALEQELAKAEVRAPIVAAIGEEWSLSPERSEAVLTGVVAAIRADPAGLMASAGFKAAAHHPPTGRAAHGMALVRQAAGAATA